VTTALVVLPSELAAVRAERPSMDEATFVALYEQTARRLRGYLRRTTGDASLADDLLQESYTRLLASGFVTDDDRHLRNYLFRIATNLVRDHYRRQRPADPEQPDPAVDADHDRHVELRADVGAALADLKPRDRQMLWLAYVEGSDHREIASALGLRAASVKSMLSRARSRLASRLHAAGFRPGGAP
jgi:RNA polymerase sigma-70 factor (ECF subfamily)